MLNATSYGGIVDGTLVQGQESSYAAINFDKKTSQGACWALSAMWLAFRSTSTGVFSDYVAWIKRPSGIRMMNNTQVEMSRRKDSGESSKIYLKAWLSKQFFVVDDASAHSEADWPATTGDVGTLTDPKAYKFINLQFRSGGHAIACQSSDANVAFFDPNYGQATFATGDNFKRWMVERLLPEYNRTFGLDWFRISSVKPGIGPKKPIA